MSRSDLPQNPKLVTRQEAARKVAELREQGVKVGFTNGVFDMLHAGHLYSMRHAKSHCDFLVIGVNSDASVRAYKGPNRPVQPEEHRSELISFLDFVDMVFVFDDESVENTIRIIKPDMIFKGRPQEYDGKELPGQKFVESYGGKCIWQDVDLGFSTSKQIDKANS